MNVFLVANKLNVESGGSNFSLDLVARSLQDRGHETTVVTTNLTSSNALPADRPYEVRSKPTSKRALFSPTAMADLFEAFEPHADVYHVFSPLLAPYAGYYRSHGGRVPVFCRLNQYRSLCSNVAKMDGECHEDCTVRRLFEHSDEALPRRLARLPFFFLQSRKYPQWMNSVDTHYALTPAVASIFAGFGVDRERIDVVPNFYDPAFAGGEEPSFSQQCERVLYVGRLSAEKGVDVLVDAVAQLPAEVTLDLVGDGPERSAIERAVERQDLEDRVTVHGRVGHDEVVEHYRRADVFVHPGQWPEPFTRTILEAWQTGCVVVASRVGGSPWVLDDAGLLFDRTDASGLARQIERCTDDEALMDRLGAASKRRLEAFAPEDVLGTIEARMEALVEDEARG